MFRIVAPLALLALATPALAQETRASANAKLDAEFAQSDANKDGALSMDELVARMSKMKVGSKPIPATNAKRLAALFMARADANKDGKVSEKESQALMSQVFNRYDLNKDGRVDGKEAAAARAAAQGMSQGKSGGAKPQGR